MVEFTWETIPTLANPTSPAAGADFSYTVPASRRLRLYMMNLWLVTDANPANRTVYVDITRGGTKLWRYPVTTTFANQTASKTCGYVFGVGLAFSDAADQTDRQAPLPDEIELKAGDIIATHTTNIQAGDQWSPHWIAKLGIE
jgi:hypothetical protein